MFSIIFYCFIFLLVTNCNTWKAVPANQAMYALRSSHIGVADDPTRGETQPDEYLPRTFIHSIYKFGWCRPDVLSRKFLKSAINLTFSTWQDTQVNYIYLLVDKHTQRFSLQCVVMKTMVPWKYMFRRSRLPLYYCQGTLMIMVFCTIHKIEIHEFYLRSRLNMPADMIFEFYHPIPL